MKVAGVTGLEPAASGVTGRRSNRLSYTPLRAATRSQRRSLPACTGSDSASQGEHEGCSGCSGSSRPAQSAASSGLKQTPMHAFQRSAVQVADLAADEEEISEHRVN